MADKNKQQICKKNNIYLAGYLQRDSTVNNI